MMLPVSGNRSSLFEIGADLAAGVSPFALRALISTCSVTVLNRPRHRELMRGTPMIGAIWHRHIAVYADFFRRSRFVILISRSRDGEIAARIVRRMGMDAVRGSSSRGGHDALYEIIEHSKRGRTVAFVADGPRGPASVAKIGVAVAAMRTGRPVLPVGCAMSRSIRARSWDRTEIPLPGSRIAISFGEPLAIPSEASPDECERFRTRVQEAIVRAEREAAKAIA
jgi:lysophospholipid acyltransferase (LPLAT)-like uncharacterized protein